MKSQFFTNEYIYPYFVSSPNSFRQFSKLVHMYNGNRNIIKNKIRNSVILHMQNLSLYLPWSVPISTLVRQSHMQAASFALSF